MEDCIINYDDFDDTKCKTFMEQIMIITTCFKELLPCTEM